MKNIFKTMIAAIVAVWSTAVYNTKMYIVKKLNNMTNYIYVYFRRKFRVTKRDNGLFYLQERRFGFWMDVTVHGQKICDANEDFAFQKANHFIVMYTVFLDQKVR